MTQPAIPVITSSLLVLSSTSSFAAIVTSDTSFAAELHFERVNGAEPLHY